MRKKGKKRRYQKDITYLVVRGVVLGIRKKELVCFAFLEIRKGV